LAGLETVKESHTARYLFGHSRLAPRPIRTAQGHLRLEGVRHNNVHDVDVDIPLGVLTSVTGISGSGKSSLVGQVLVDLVARHLGHHAPSVDEEDELETVSETIAGRITAGLDRISRLVKVDQKPIGRTPRSNLATYTGLFDDVRKRFAATKAARSRH
jgi:excinuclease ABC subunit A